MSKRTTRSGFTQAVEIITRFDGYHGRYVFHCHNAEHEDMAMVADFVVT